MIFCLLDYIVILDTAVLNYALTLEHLENVFYTGALARFGDKAFQNAGLPSSARARFLRVALHQATHVAVAIRPLTYSLFFFFFWDVGFWEDS
jgi:hypothetical protein